ncbi:hypothetical protein ACJIZ3_019278 [Penstemon smallii]|uniref:Uncharacterized protein n=1 Tax=Penstemon smallii TaxID=265156 RepID=A0ABD3T1E9_9LAMI
MAFPKPNWRESLNLGLGFSLLILRRAFKPKIKIFQDLGFSANEVAMIISNDPAILSSSIDNRIIPSLSLLKGLFDSNVEVATVLKGSRRFLSMDLDNVLVPNVEFLKSLGIPMNQILRQFLLSPWLFLYKPENLRKLVEKADKMGVDRGSKVNAPLGLGVSVEKMKKVKEVLLETGNVEKRYKPRLQVLVDLEKKNLIKKWPRLSTLYSVPDEIFLRNLLLRTWMMKLVKHSLQRIQSMAKVSRKLLENM